MSDIFAGQVTVGFWLSTTLTTAVHVAEFPPKSVTVRVTVLLPTFAQVNDVGLATMLAIAQLSVLPLPMLAAVILAVPVPLSTTVRFWQTAVGGVVSKTVTVAVQVLVFPFTSSAVNTTVLAPTF